MKRKLSFILAVVLLLSSLTLMAGAYTMHHGDYKSGDFYYNILNNGTIEITYYAGNDPVLTIPAQLDGKRVSLVGSWYMFDMDYRKIVKEIIIENGVKTIVDLGDCPNLKKVTIPKSVTRLEEGAFFECTSLDTVVGGENVVYCGNIAFGDTPFFKNSRNWRNGQFYFGKCLLALNKNYAGALNVRSDVTCIADDVFRNCKNLTSVYIPASVRYFRALSYGGSNFWNCPKLTKITVSKDNKYFSSVSGILFNKSLSVLCRYPSARSGKTYTVPKTVKKIAEAAFEGSRYLTAVNFDKNSKCMIDEYAFYNCKCIKTMTIPKNVTFMSECPGMGLYNDGRYVADYRRNKNQLLKGFVLKGYASSETVFEYAAIFNLNFVTLCKDGKAHKTETVKAKKATYFADGHTAYQRCKVCGEKIGYRKIARPVLERPVIAVAAGKGIIKVKYNAVKNATGFQIRYIDKNGKRVTKTYTTSQTKTVTLSGITKGQYNVYVRAFVKSGKQVACSPWTVRTTVTVK